MITARLWAIALALFAGLALLPLALDPWRVGQLAQYLTYGLLAMSLALIWGQAGILSFGHAVFFGLGAYAMGLVTLGMAPGLGHLADGGWRACGLGLVAALAAPALAANLLGRFLFHGRGLQGAHVAIVMLAVAVVVERLLINVPYVGGLNGLMNVPPLALPAAGGSVELIEPVPLFYVTLAVVIVAYVLLQSLVESRKGVVLRAIREDERRAAFFGHATHAEKTRAFTLAGATAGLAGGLFAAQFGFVAPPLAGFALSTEVLIWVALGGRSLLLAAFLGTIAVRLIETRLYDALGAYWLLALGGLFVLSVVALPRGLIGEVLHRLVAPARPPREGAG
jgi:urea transport system permease protein